MERELITVGIGEYKVVRGKKILKAILGSCVGVVIYDKVNKIGGLAHVYLPLSSEYKDKYVGNNNSYKYADLLIPYMLKELIKKKANRRFLIAYIVGGATLFKMKKAANILNIGEKNLAIVKQVLKENNITFFELHVGGNTGRTLKFDIVTGDIFIKNLNKLH